MRSVVAKAIAGDDPHRLMKGIARKAESEQHTSP
jgi:hypothetical protein